jgi:formylmethanofuran dehydrogenase subunit E
VHDKKEELKSAIETAERLHGHLGPFLVVGVRMGRTAMEILNHDTDDHELRVTAKIPLQTPFSCVLDGIQATTKCTIGNQRLRIEDSQKEISATFEKQNSTKMLRVTVSQKVVEDLVNRASEGVSNEKLAWKIARTPVNRLFTIEKR